MSQLNAKFSVRAAVRHVAAAMVLVGGLAGCGSFDVPDFNNQSLADLENNPSPSGVATVAQGLLTDMRTAAAEHAQDLGIIGREAYNLSAANGTLPTYLQGPLNTGVFFVLFTWRQGYQGMRDANILLHALDNVSGMTNEQKEGVRGFAKTVQAYLLLHLIVQRDTFGIPIDVDRPVGDLAPIAPKAQVYARIDQLLDEAKTHLGAAGTAFAFGLTPGFAGFNTPATFLQVNRAIKARADVYNNDWAGALAALAESFIDTTAALTLGSYHTYTTNSGDATNPMFRNDFFWAVNSVLNDAQPRTGGIDLRAETKIRSGPVATLAGVTGDMQFNEPSSPTSPQPMIRNEELILLRAEANLGLGNFADATTDINTIRVKAGGLAPIANPGAAGPLLTELLYNKRYSLMWEWGHRWADNRHYGRLATLDRDLPAHRIFDILPYEQGECFARNNTPAGCTGVAGL